MAADIYKWIVIIAGITLLLNMGGLQTGAGLILEKLGVDIFNNPQDISLSNFFITASAIFTAASVIGITIGLLVTSSPESFLLLGYTSLLLSFVADAISIISYTSQFGGWVSSIVSLIFIPLALGYLHSVVSWWGGKG